MILVTPWVRCKWVPRRRCVGIRTAQSDIDLIHERLKLAQQHYKNHHEHQR